MRNRYRKMMLAATVVPSKPTVDDYFELFNKLFPQVGTATFNLVNGTLDRRYTHELYAITLTYQDRTLKHPQRVNDYLKKVYSKLCQVIKKNHFTRTIPKQMRPMVFGMIEFDDTVTHHHHLILAIHPEHKDKFDALIGKDTVKALAPEIVASSQMDAIYDLDGWWDYCKKRTRNTDNIVFLPE